MQSRTVEIWVGIFVAFGFAALVMLAMQVSNLSSLYANEGYIITAEFENVGGLKVRSPVKMGGVRIGRIEKIVYDDEKYNAVVNMRINGEFSKIPIDTSASILTSGLLGEQYIGLVPGGEDLFLADSDKIDPGLTQSAMILENLIGQFLYNMASGETSSEKSSTGE